jgi:hypothetical protein
MEGLHVSTEQYDRCAQVVKDVWLEALFVSIPHVGSERQPNSLPSRQRVRRLCVVLAACETRPTGIGRLMMAQLTLESCS